MRGAPRHSCRGLFFPRARRSYRRAGECCPDTGSPVEPAPPSVRLPRARLGARSRQSRSHQAARGHFRSGSPAHCSGRPKSPWQSACRARSKGLRARGARQVLRCQADWISLKSTSMEGGHKAALLRGLRTGSCGWYTTILGPGTDAAHATHWHLDIQQHGSSQNYRICQ